MPTRGSKTAGKGGQRRAPRVEFIWGRGGGGAAQGRGSWAQSFGRGTPTVVESSRRRQARARRIRAAVAWTAQRSGIQGRRRQGGKEGQRVARVGVRRRKSAPDLGQTSERSNSQSVLAGEVAISAWISSCIGLSGKSAESKLLNRRETAAGVLPNKAVAGRRFGRFLERIISSRKAGLKVLVN